jgi:hypothetical protein
MVIRSSLVQIRTPPDMRGRVSAVHSLFTGTSNQLGAFESGVVAALWMALFPELRRLRGFEEDA